MRPSNAPRAIKCVLTTGGRRTNDAAGTVHCRTLVLLAAAAPELSSLSRSGSPWQCMSALETACGGEVTAGEEAREARKHLRMRPNMQRYSHYNMDKYSKFGTPRRKDRRVGPHAGRSRSIHFRGGGGRPRRDCSPSRSPSRRRRALSRPPAKGPCLRFAATR